uniref:Uncharacterized protein n=2 Tax=Meloidogyne incognita group TaxID=654580 RepID=A0A914MUX7_MELIC
MSDERRSLHTENVELQRRLEGLTPLLAEKETKLIKLEQEIEILNNKLKQQIKEIENLKINLEEKLKENLKQKSEGERIEQRFKLNIETLNNELEESKIREADLERELSETKIKSEQREASYRREEHERYQRVIDELNEQLQQTNERFERSERERNEAEIKIDELRQKNDILEMELELAHDKMSQQQETSRTLEEKQRELHLQEKEHRSAQVRAQRELEALQSLSQSLANENKGLREERADLEERIGELTEMLNIRENRVKRAAELINEFLERYRLTSGRLKQQIGRQAEDCEEFDRLIQKLRQMVNIVSNNPESPTIITNRDGSLITNLRPSTTASSSTNSPSLLSTSKATKQRNINKNIGGIKTNINNNRRTKTD